YSDLVILNKVDLADAERVDHVRSFVKERLPTVRIVEAEYADVPFEVLIGTRPEHLDGAQITEEHDHEHDHRFVSWVYRRSGPFDLAALQRTIASLPRSVYRIKGFVYGNCDRERRQLLQAVGMRADIVPYDPWGAAEPETCLVIIADSETTDHDNVVGRLDACRVMSNDGAARRTQ
ncbi:MAG: CobW family GTP-binding protein, partial [Acidimicrobiales bacterium]